MKLIIIFFLTSLTTLSSWASGNPPIAIDMVNHPSKKWRFTDVKTYANDEGVRVKGYITADHTFGLPTGYVNISAYSSNGELISETTSKYFPGKLRYKAGRKGKVRFSTVITKKIPPNSMIKIAFHSSKPGAESSPIHD